MAAQSLTARALQRQLPHEVDVGRRYERGSMLETRNRSVSEWGGVFGDAVVAAAILDRLLHVITIRGDSYRLRTKRRAGLVNSIGPVQETAA